MVRKIAVYFQFLIISIFISSGCSYSSAYYSTDNKQKQEPTRFAIFVVNKSDTLKAEKGNINDVKISKTPIISDQDIVVYEWSTHKLTLTKDMNETLSKHIGDSFIIMVHGVRIYSGAFWSQTSPAIVKFPVILVDGTTLEIKNGYPIEAQTGNNDPRKDSRIYNALIDTGKLIE